MHETIKLIYGLLTGDATLICLFSAVIIYSAYIFNRNNSKNQAAAVFSIVCIGTMIFWLLIDIFPGVNTFLFTLFFLSGTGLAAFAWLKKDKLFFRKKENIDPGILIILFGALYAALVLKTAWFGDDSFITFRTADNFIHGFGLTWNVEERVQAYTNTLWMFAVSALYFITRNIFISVMLLSAAFMFLAFYSLRKSSSGRISFAIVFFSLIMSKAFIDYSTSGLENPLTFCLLAVFYRLYFEPEPPKYTAFWLSLTASMIFLNKPDAALLVILPLAYHLMLGKQKSLLPAFLGTIPVAAWEIFSLVYYGFPLPNTFYAKLFTGVPSMDVLVQGLKYTANSLCMDPLTLALALSGAAAGFYAGDPGFKKKRLFSIGIMVYILYVIKTGGDFMTGRFFTPAEFTGALLISGLNFDRVKNSWMAAFAAALFLGFLSPYYSASRAFTPEKYFYGKFSNVTDERQFYFLDDYGIKSVLSEVVKNGDITLAFSGFAMDGLRLKAYAGDKRTVSSAVAVGMKGFFAGPSSYIIDNAALADAFLARVPFDGTRWRPGHVSRIKVDGYIESLTQGVNVIKDPKYAALYDKINLVTKGPLFTAERWKTILELNTEKLP
jgi:arabinofuranosyltransferase